MPIPFVRDIINSNYAIVLYFEKTCANTFALCLLGVESSGSTTSSIVLLLSIVNLPLLKGVLINNTSMYSQMKCTPL